MFEGANDSGAGMRCQVWRWGGSLALMDAAIALGVSITGCRCKAATAFRTALRSIRTEARATNEWVPRGRREAAALSDRSNALCQSLLRTASIRA